MSDITQPSPGSSVSPSDGLPEPLKLGQIVGSFRVVRRIGDGGMGTVYLAEHQQIGYRAAIKVLHSEFAQHPEVAGRFLNEARATNLIQHPGVVKIFEYGRLPDRTTYVIMEYVEGEGLLRRIDRLGGKLLVADALRLTRQIASALSAAHEHGVVHRDLKPANVILVPDPEAEGRERAKLLDFGLAKVAGTFADTRRSPTRTGVVLGTALYMAPEQCRGARDVDGRADVYSLGVMLYEMLSGRTPFCADSEGELVTMHLRDPVPPLQKVLPELPPQVAELVHDLLNKDPLVRPTARELTSRLESLAPRKDTTETAPVGRVSAARPARRRATVGVMALALLGLLLTAVGVGSRMWPRGDAAQLGAWLQSESGVHYHLRAIWRDPAGRLWVVGDNGTILARQGGGWQKVASGTTQSLRGVFGSSDRDIWAVGGQGSILHWDGVSWSIQPPVSTAGLRGVWAHTEREVWAVGEQGTILRFDGARWARVPSDVKEDFRAVWGPSGQMVWAVGEYGAIARYDGITWQPVKSGTTSRLAKVWGLSPGEVWAVGNEGTILRWDGAAWRAEVSGSNEELSAIYGDRERGIWVSGNGGTLLLQAPGSGASWHRAQGVDPRSWIYGLWGGDGEVWAVGTYGVILHHR